MDYVAIKFRFGQTFLQVFSSQHYIWTIIQNNGDEKKKIFYAIYDNRTFA